MINVTVRGNNLTLNSERTHLRFKRANFETCYLLLKQIYNIRES